MGKRLKRVGHSALTASECSLRLRMSRERVVRLIQTGHLKGYRDPERGWLVEPTALDHFTSGPAGPAA